MGVVWEGKHRGTGAGVAVKFMTAVGARRPRYVAAFRREVAAVAQLHHPDIIRVHDVGVAHGLPYMVMELAESALNPLVPPENWEALQSLLAHLLRALGHAHASHILHRDVKPENVVICGAVSPRPGPKLADFGISMEREDQGFTGCAGTPVFMAPECFDKRFLDIGPWTDLYGLGCTAWSLVTGLPPFPLTEIRALATAHKWQPPPPLSASIAVPAGLEDWLLRQV